MLCIFMNLFIEYIIAYNILMKPGFCGLPSRLNKVKRSKVQESSRAIGKYFFFCSKKRDDYHFFFFLFTIWHGACSSAFLLLFSTVYLCRYCRYAKSLHRGPSLDRLGKYVERISLILYYIMVVLYVSCSVVVVW